MYNKNMLCNNGYFNIDSMPLLDGNRAYIRVDSVDTGSFRIKNDTKLIARVGPKTSFMIHPAEFNPRSSPRTNWDFKYNNARCASFVVAIFKKRIFGGDLEIGEVELKLSGFEPNKVTTGTFNMMSPQGKNYNASVKVSVHLSEDGSFPFTAPEDGKILQNPIIPHAHTYCF